MTARRLQALAPAVAALSLGACGVAAPVPMQMAPPPVPAGPSAAMQFLYGSGEAAALSQQAFNGLVNYVRAALADARDARGRLPHQRAPGTAPRWPRSAVLAPGSTAATPDTLPCAALPPAVVFDMDETVVLNLGFQYADARSGAGFDPKRWEQWERTGADALTAAPGAVAAFRQLRASGVTIVINTNRNAATAADSERALAHAGLGSFRHGQTLFLRGDVDGRPGKDGRRTAIAARYCVLAQAGDQLGDFADFFNPPGAAPASGRRALPGVSSLVARWGSGWFVFPNPVYGTALGSGWDDTFPPDTHWSAAP